MHARRLRLHEGASRRRVRAAAAAPRLHAARPGREAQGVARRQMGSGGHQLQRRRPRGGRQDAHVAQHRRVGGQLLRTRHAGLGARLEEARGVSREAGIPPPRALRRVLARGSAATEALDALLRQARRRPRPRTTGHLRHREQAGAGHRQRALPQSLRSLEARVAQGQLRAHLRIQPARPRGVQDHRGECRHRRRAGRHLGRAEDLLHLFGQEVPARCRRRPRGRLDVGAGRLEPPLSLRRRDGRGKEPDHDWRLGGPRRLARRR